MANRSQFCDWFVVLYGTKRFITKCLDFFIRKGNFIGANLNLQLLTELTMKRLLMLVAVLLAAVSCFDDSEIWDTIMDHEDRILKLEILCKELNTNISSLQTLVEALECGDFITDITPITEDGKEIGYTITFIKSSPITIYHGKDGTNSSDGKDGAIPMVGVKKDTDGVYYWTLDGEWILDDEGNKLKAEAKDAITPQLKVEEGCWYVSYDNGKTWERLYQVEVGDGMDSSEGSLVFLNVDYDDESVHFTMSDGTLISVPRRVFLAIEFDSEDLVLLAPGSTRDIRYIVTSVLPDVQVEALASGDLDAVAIPDETDPMMGVIRVTSVGDTIKEHSRVVVLVSNGEKVIMKSLKFEAEVITVVDEAHITVPAEGGVVELLYLTNLECDVIIPNISPQWVSLAPDTKTLQQRSICLQLEPNDGLMREAIVTIQNKDASLKLEYKITQEANASVQLQAEREALVAIYNALNGDAWPNNENWCTDKPLSEWYGVDTDSKGSVVALRIYGDMNNLGEKTPFPKEVCNLTNLYDLMIDCTNVDSFPSEISSLKLRSFYSTENIYLTLSEMKPIYDGPKLLENFSVVNHDRSYFVSEQSMSPQPIPEELLENLNLQTISLMACNLSGTIPEEICNLTSLTGLVLYNIWDTYLTGELPNAISNLTELTCLNLFNLNLSGGIPDGLYTLSKLMSLSIDSCHIGGSLSSQIGSLQNLTSLNLRDANLKGELPKELALLMDNLDACMLDGNGFYGDIPEEITSHPKWKTFWTSIISRNNLNVTYGDIPAPEFDTYDVWGNNVKSSEQYAKNTYTVLYEYDVAMFPYMSNAVYSCYDMHMLYNAYHDLGVDIIMFNTIGWDEQVRQFLNLNDIPWTTLCYAPFGMCSIPNVTVVNSQGEVVFSTIISTEILMFSDILAFFEDKFSEVKYTSNDYSADGQVTTLQTATKGNGIDIVLMGDGYSDRQIEGGIYRADMEYMYNHLFEKEPFRTHKDMFNVSFVNVVSATEGYLYHDTALNTLFLGDTFVAGDDMTCFNYALNAISAERMDEALIIVAMNSEVYAGTCYMYYPSEVSGTYGTGPSIAYFPKGTDAEMFAQLLHHEANGHGFAKLADEYAYELYGEVPADYVTEIEAQQDSWGWWKNVDFTNNPDQVRWSQFLGDSRYAGEGLGCFEGGLTYWTGVWRPTEDSIMRYNVGEFNAPSREAIYYRIHKLAYGDSWEYNYEDFAAYDAVNRTSASAPARRQRANYVEHSFEPTAPPVVVGKPWTEAK